MVSLPWNSTIQQLGNWEKETIEHIKTNATRQHHGKTTIRTQRIAPVQLKYKIKKLTQKIWKIFIKLRNQSHKLP